MLGFRVLISWAQYIHMFSGHPALVFPKNTRGILCIFWCEISEEKIPRIQKNLIQTSLFEQQNASLFNMHFWQESWQTAAMFKRKQATSKVEFYDLQIWSAPNKTGWRIINS